MLLSTPGADLTGVVELNTLTALVVKQGRSGGLPCHQLENVDFGCDLGNVHYVPPPINNAAAWQGMTEEEYAEASRESAPKELEDEDHLVPGVLREEPPAVPTAGRTEWRFADRVYPEGYDFVDDLIVRSVDVRKRYPQVAYRMLTDLLEGNEDAIDALVHLGNLAWDRCKRWPTLPKYYERAIQFAEQTFPSPFTCYFRWEQVETRPYLRALDSHWKSLWLTGYAGVGVVGASKAFDGMPHSAHDIRQAMPFLEREDTLNAWGR
ncbi:MAG: hypothetical protein J0L75_04920 [Spirochaetes bacterium]|nr:hypothetical protein [Spirochaetota bacterium]